MAKEGNPVIRRLLTVLALVPALAPPPAAAGDGAVRELRAAGRYEEALALARAERGKLDPAALPGYRIDDADRLVATLETAVALSSDRRELLREADRLDLDLDRDLELHHYASAYTAAARQLEIRYELLGLLHMETLETLVRLARIAEFSDLATGRFEFLAMAEAVMTDVVGDAHPIVVEVSALYVRAWRGFDPATTYYEKAMAALEAVGENHVLLAEVIHAWGNHKRRRMQVDSPGIDPLTVSRERLADAEPFYRRALELRMKEVGEAHIVTIDNLVWLSFLLHQLGKNEEAKAGFTRALQLLDERGFTEHPLRATILTLLSDNAKAEGDPKRAEELARRAARHAESARDEQLPMLRSWGLHSYFSLADLLLRRGAEQEAWDALRAGLGPLSLDALRLHEFRTGPRTPETKRHERDRHALQEAQSRFQAAYRPWVSHAAGVTREEVAALLVKSTALRGALLPEWFGPESTRGKREDLDPRPARSDEAFVGWFVLGDDVWSGRNDHVAWAYVVRSEGDVTFVRLGEWSEAQSYQEWRGPSRNRLDRLASASVWQGSLESDPEFDALSRDVSGHLFDPLLPLLEGIDRLVLLPSVGLTDQNVVSLLDEQGVPLGVRFAISHASSPEIYTRLVASPSRESPGGRTALLVGDPAYGDSTWAARHTEVTSIDQALLRSVLAGDPGALEKLPRLPFAGREVSQLGAMFPAGATMLVGPAASETRVMQLARDEELAQYDTVHLATHVLYDGTFFDSSALALCNRKPDGQPATGHSSDGLITMGDVHLSWRLHADLVTFSGCQTAVSPRGMDMESGSGFLLPTLAAGARSIVASRWKVHDHATFLFMKRFYENLTGTYEDEREGATGEQLPKTLAMRDARAWLREYTAPDGSRPYEHPVYWSAFFLFGDPN